MVRDPVLSYQLSQGVALLLQRPGMVSMENVRRIAEHYGFETFSEHVENTNREQITIAGRILLIDIEFAPKSTTDAEGDAPMTDTRKYTVESVTCTLASDQRVKELYEQYMNSETSSSPEEIAQVALVYHLKQLYSFTSETAARPPSGALLESLQDKMPAQAQPNRISYDSVPLDRFSDTLAYLAILDKLSCYDPGSLFVTNDTVLKGPGTVPNNANLFDYLRDLALVLDLYSASQKSVLLRNVQEADVIYDVLNGYKGIGTVCVNPEDPGVYIRYWENGRRLHYRQQKSDDMEPFSAYEQQKPTDPKYVRLGMDYHYENGIILLHGLIRSESYKFMKNSTQPLDLKTATCKNVSVLSKIVLPYLALVLCLNPACKAVLSVQLPEAMWVPENLAVRSFEGCAVLLEARETQRRSDPAFRSKLRGAVQELYIENYEGLFEGSNKGGAPEIREIIETMGVEYETEFPKKGIRDVKVRFLSSMPLKLVPARAVNVYSHKIDKCGPKEISDDELKQLLTRFSSDSTVSAASAKGPFLNANSTVYLDIDPVSGHSFKTTVSSAGEQPINDFFGLLERFLGNLRSILMVWSLIESLSQKCSKCSESSRKRLEKATKSSETKLERRTSTSGGRSDARANLDRLVGDENAIEDDDDKEDDPFIRYIDVQIGFVDQEDGVYDLYEMRIAGQVYQRVELDMRIVIHDGKILNVEGSNGLGIKEFLNYTEDLHLLVEQLIK